MNVSDRWIGVVPKVAAVAAAFVVGLLAARFLTHWAAYHTRPAVGAEGAAVCRARVDRVVGDEGQAQVKVTITSGPYSGQRLRAMHASQSAHGHDAVGVGEGWLVDVRSLDGRLTAHLLSRERDGYLVALSAALAALLAVTAGRKGVATLGSVAWALALLVGLMLPAVSIGAPAATWSVPLALAIAAPTLIAIGGFNRKSIAALGGTLCGLMAGGLLAAALVEAMALTGLEAEFGPYHHLDNLLWFAEPLHEVRFGSLLVAGMLLAGLGAVMDVSMAVASTVAEVHRIAPPEHRWGLFRSGLAAGRDIFGVMVFTLTLVFVGSHLIFFVSVGPAWQADRWLRLTNYEQTASELARAAATAVGMALSVPATALLAAMFFGNRTSPEGERAPRPLVRLASIVRPFLAAMVCLAAAGLADELMLRGYQGGPGRREPETLARVVAFDEPVVELDAESADPHEKTFFRSQVAVIQPYFGSRAGELLTSRLLLGPNPSHNLVLQRGAAVHVSAEETIEGTDVQFRKPPLRYRWGLIAFVITAAMVIVTGGRGGVRMLAVMLAAAALMIGVLIPLLAEGRRPLLTTGVFCVVMLLAVLAITGTADRKALAAIVGSAVGLGIAAGLLILSCRWLGFTGRESVPARFLEWASEGLKISYDYTGLLAAGLMVAFLGLAMDTAVTVAAGVAQVCGAQPGIKRWEAVAAGMNISRDVVGTMVLTLLFAFVGMRLPVFLLPAALNMSAAEMINSEAGASEVLDALVGSIALAATGPATALVASLLMAERRTSVADSPKRPLPRWLAALAVAAIATAVTAGGAGWWHLREDRSSRATLPALPSDTADLLERAVQARQSQRTGEALLALWTARQRSPQDPRVRTELAYAYMIQRYVVQARREIEAAFAMGADDSVAHYVAGVVYAWTDQGEKAERHLRRAVTLDPHNVSARETLERLFGQ